MRAVAHGNMHDVSIFHWQNSVMGPQPCRRNCNMHPTVYYNVKCSNVLGRIISAFLAGNADIVKK